MTHRVLKAENFDLIESFEQDREHLFNQFQNVIYDPRTGVEPQELSRMVANFTSENPDLPRVLLKAHSFRIVGEL